MNTIVNREVKVLDLGLIDYQEAWDYQTKIFNSTLGIKKANRERSPSGQLPTENFLLFCEHQHVFTLGKSGDEKNLLISTEKLHTIDATYVHTNRGGDITYHGPGQIVVYPILDLENFFTDIHKYMRFLEESVIQTLAEFGISSGRIPGLTGVWLDPEEDVKARKICALGVKTSRWVTMHGLAFNVNSDLNYFKHIVPCGIDNKSVTSLHVELGKQTDISKVKEILKQKLISSFEMTLRE